MPEFSSTELLISMGGDGVHNEFLRILVELGPVGLGLLLFIAIPFVRLGRQNFQWVSFYALVGHRGWQRVHKRAASARTSVAVVRFSLAAISGRRRQARSAAWRPPAQTTTRYAALALGALALAALIEVALSFGRYPFTYGQRCLKVHPIEKDGWTQGVLRVPVPPAAASAELAIVADRPDLARRPLDLDLSVLSGGGSSLATQRHTFMQRDAGARTFQLQMPESSDGNGSSS